MIKFITDKLNPITCYPLKSKYWCPLCPGTVSVSRHPHGRHTYHGLCTRCGREYNFAVNGTISQVETADLYPGRFLDIGIEHWSEWRVG